MPDTVAQSAIQDLCIYLSRYYKQKVIILLDEYDTPMQEAYIHGYWDAFTAFMRSFFNAVFKTNPYLERAVMTGITRISKESIFSVYTKIFIIHGLSQVTLIRESLHRTGHLQVPMHWSVSLSKRHRLILNR